MEEVDKCEYCQGDKVIYDKGDWQDYIRLTVIDDSIYLSVGADGQSAADESIKINYCPMCGRKLEANAE